MTMMLWMVLLYFAVLPTLSISITVILHELFRMRKGNHSFSKKELISVILVFIIALVASPPIIFKTVMQNEGLTYVETGKTAYYIEPSEEADDLVSRIKLDGITYEDFYWKLSDTSFIFEEQTVEKTSENMGKPIANLVGADIGLDAPTALEQIVSRVYGMHTNFDLIYSTNNKNIKHCIFYSTRGEICLYSEPGYTEELIHYYLDAKNYNFYLSYYDESKEMKVKLDSESNESVWDTTLKAEPINFNYDAQVMEAFPDAVVKTLDTSGEISDMSIVAVSKDAVIGKYLADVYVEGNRAYQVLGFYDDGSENYDVSKVYVLPLPEDISQSILARL